MGKLIEILTQDEKARTAEQAEFEAQQQDVNLQSAVIQTQQAMHQATVQRTTALRAGGPNMWAEVLAADTKIAELQATLDRMSGYRSEFLA